MTGRHRRPRPPGRSGAGRTGRRRWAPASRAPLRKWTICLSLALLVLVGCGGEDDGADPVADGTGEVAAGEQLYSRTCAMCHGQELEGTTRGPTFLHEVYVPSHHDDESFRTAVRRGVAPHHWDFGPMPPIGGLSDQDIADLIAYVRSEQQEAGITD